VGASWAFPLEKGGVYRRMFFSTDVGRTIGVLLPEIPSAPVIGCGVLAPQYDENTVFFSSFSLKGFMPEIFYWVIPLEFQERKHQPFPMGQSSKQRINEMIQTRANQ